LDILYLTNIFKKKNERNRTKAMSVALRYIPPVPEIAVGNEKPYEYRGGGKNSQLLQNAVHNSMAGMLTQVESPKKGAFFMKLMRGESSLGWPTMRTKCLAI
jgi:hypothetical protein